MSKSDLQKLVEERPGVCSLCSASVSGKIITLEKSEKKYEGKPVFLVTCSDEHRPLQSPNLGVVEDKEKGFVEVIYGSLE